MSAINENKNGFVCSGCGAVLKHQSSLSLHKNGNVKKGVKPCRAYYASIGKQYEEKIESRNITEEEYKTLMSAFEKVMRWVEKEESKPSVPRLELVGFGEQYPPPHVSMDYIKTMFMKKRPEEFTALMFSAFHTNLNEGRRYCTVRIPKESHDNEMEVFYGGVWRYMNIATMLDVFINGNPDLHPSKRVSLLSILQEMEDGDDYEYADKLGRYEAWTPDDEDEIKKGLKTDEDEDGNTVHRRYNTLKKHVKTILLNHKDDLKLIKKEYVQGLTN